MKGLQGQNAKRCLQSFHNDEDGRSNASGDIMSGEMNREVLAVKESSDMQRYLHESGPQWIYRNNRECACPAARTWGE